MAAFRALRGPQYGSPQFNYELRDQYAKVTDYLYLCSNNAAQQADRVRRLGITAEVYILTMFHLCGIGMIDVVSSLFGLIL